MLLGLIGIGLGWLIGLAARSGPYAASMKVAILAAVAAGFAAGLAAGLISTYSPLRIVGGVAVGTAAAGAFLSARRPPLRPDDGPPAPGA